MTRETPNTILRLLACLLLLISLRPGSTPADTVDRLIFTERGASQIGTTEREHEKDLIGCTGIQGVRSDGFGISITTVLARLGVSLCSGISNRPTAEANGPYEASCGGQTTVVQLSSTGSIDPDPGDSITYGWTTTCPGGVFDDPQNPSPKLTLSTAPGCSMSCMVTLTVTDRTGNTATEYATVTITDATPPEITCPENKRIEFDASADPSNTGQAEATDTCDSNPKIDFADWVAPGATPELTTIRRTWRATDACGNWNTCRQIITKQGTTTQVAR
jgi:hypothetical protein